MKIDESLSFSAEMSLSISNINAHNFITFWVLNKEMGPSKQFVPGGNYRDYNLP